MPKREYFVLLQGGLGNQLFQYTFAESLRINESKNVSLDSSALTKNLHYDETSIRELAIQGLPHDKKITRKMSVSELRNSRIWNANRRKPWNLLRIGYTKVWITKIVQLLQLKLVLDESRWNERKSYSYLFARTIIMDGFWQDYKYPTGIEVALKSRINSRLRCCQYPMNLEKQIRSESALALHVRRGDYVSNPQANEFHGALSATYYNKAISSFGASKHLDTIYVFSDDSNWCRENLTANYKLVFMSDLLDDICDFDELQLMSACSYFIIANSTFSWWAAWLSNSDGSHILAPSAWFQDETANARSLRLIPKDWARIPSDFYSMGEP